jgi:hypothetical protein
VALLIEFPFASDARVRFVKVMTTMASTPRNPPRIFVGRADQ